MSLPGFDEALVSPEFLADPYPIYSRLRSEAPVYWSDSWKAWLITRYRDVASALLDPRRFSSAGRVTSLLAHLPQTERHRLHPLESHFASGLINSDPPDHTRVRALINKAFTPRRVEVMRPRVDEIVGQLLDQVQSKGQMDVVRDLAYPLPAIVIAEMLGVPVGDRDSFKLWADEISSFQGTGRATAAGATNSQEYLLQMRAYLRDLIENRRQHPREDLLSAMVAAEEEGNKLSLEELLSTCVTLMIAGHETTTCLITLGLWLLLQNSDEMRRLKQDPALVNSAVEEFLRYESPIQKDMRRVTEDAEFGGKRLRRGDIALLMLGAANRDPEQFTEPDRFDIGRKENRHLAFGYGIHFCVGASLARLEAPIAIKAVLDRMPNLQLSEQPVDWRRGAIFRYLESLSVAF